MDLKKIIQSEKGTIVDVRTPAEFQGGHASGSINIPVNELAQRIDELKRLKSPLVLCCASGGRSAMATRLLSQHEFDCIDAGSWVSVNYLQNQSINTL